MPYGHHMVYHIWTMACFFGVMLTKRHEAVYKLQNLALRIIFNNYLSSSKPLFEKYNVLNIWYVQDRD